MTEELTLDDLFRTAKEHLRAEAAAKVKAVKRTGEPKARTGAKLYSDPDNWNRGHNIALLHRPTQTLLGVFSEWLHKTEPEVRKLVREESELPIHHVEEVEGEWGAATPKALDHAASEARFEIIETLITLTAPAVTAYACLHITLQGAGILSVRLGTALSFGAADTLLQLPAGTDILSQMTHESKLSLRSLLPCVLNL